MLFNSDLIDMALTLIITLQSTQIIDLLSYYSLSSCIKKLFSIPTIPNKDDIVNLHSLLLDQLKNVSYANTILKYWSQSFINTLNVDLSLI